MVDLVFGMRLDQLNEPRAVRRNKALTLMMPVGQALPISLVEPFYAFVRVATMLR